MARSIEESPEDVRWRRSTKCDDDDCLEVAFPRQGTVLVRHSSHPEGPVIELTTAEWDAFLGGVMAGEFSPPSSFN
jgi:hypothetical protein